MTNFNASVARTLNAGADLIGYLIPPKMIAPTLLGAIGGWLVGVGPKMGLLQGIATGVTYSWVLKPIANYVSENSGPGPNQINAKACGLLAVVGAVVETAGPILVTMYIGSKCITATTPYLPSFVNWILSTEPTAEYNLFRGLFVSVAPAIAQHAIENLRSK